ncbi:sodium- and chloride-dependent GABA transporter 1 [Scleropages formosus]|uniref:Transporter n=1 Tax=Scleropages formosus TaxID=113540 RepID=A0A8C9TBL1_SCLFO|nr:sodium- and chloride-dependent GABA transporter 1-like [Scleropages formosus]XP_018604596.2 sodium- and chloride-dependent GABA transporter 1-like [Scleropages formosus]XP_018604597.2 sodium- and chloride-dependent GABA transporter 1-like [Scleropages formosus]XP_018604598.2 sodium- and chloride-dependent GABA transporter 1-like [Scleropages formosus]
MGVGAENTEAVSKLSASDAGDKEETGLVRAHAVKTELEPTDTAHEDRGTWGRRLEFVLASVGYAVGLGNVWRFPYLCYRSGGGAFLIPYVIMLFLCGIPLLLMEFAIGQYTRLGPVLTLAKICPLLKGVGLATVVISFILCTYYNVLMTWALYYLFNSFGTPLPWQSCNNTWNLVSNCSTGFPGNATHLWSSSQQFFDYKLLEMTDGIEQMGELRWELFGLLVLAWIIVYLCIFKGVKSTGKVVYFTATFPYFILFTLLINNVQLPGANDGILYFLMPNWGKLLEVQVWVNAAAQIFNSIGIAFGSMISMASYNKFNNNIIRDTLIVALANSATSILAGFVIFSAIGYMAHVHHLPVDNIATDGPGLVFVVYPEIFSTLPVSQLWASLFFLMLLCLGLDSQFAMVEVAVTCLMDCVGPKLLKVLKHKELVVLAVCTIGFLLGIPHITQGGIYVFQLMDHYTAVVSLMFLAFFEVLAVCWIFGVRRIACMVERMLGKPPNAFFQICWLVVSPLLVLCILISSIVQYTPARYGKTYTYPAWAEVLGWFISLLSIVWIPLGALHELCTSKGKLLHRLKASLLPTVELGGAERQPDNGRVQMPDSVPLNSPLRKLGVDS